MENITKTKAVLESRPAQTQHKTVKKKIGRKWFDGKDEEDVIAKCKEVWAIDGTDEEAAFYAEVSKFSISRYLQEHSDLKEIRNRLKERPILKARQTIVKNLDNPQEAKWYLERKRKNEFSERRELSGENGGPIEQRIIYLPQREPMETTSGKTDRSPDHNT